MEKMETKGELYHQHGVELRRFQKACDQILQLNGKLDGLIRRYKVAMDTNNKVFRYSLRSRMLVVEGMLTAYCNYANLKKQEILKLRRRFHDADEIHQIDDDDETDN